MLDITTHRWLCLSLCTLVWACGPDEPAAGTGDGTTTGGADPAETSGTTGEPELLCPEGQPLQGGNAGWMPPPFEPPAAGEPKEDDGDSSGGDSGVGFVSAYDVGGGVSLECSVWDQDCPAGEKCNPWANDGGDQHNALKCSPLDPDPAQPGEACNVEGSAVSGVDDCDLGVLCWEVDGATLEGTCVAMCQGNEAQPQCAEGEFCWIGNDGVLPLCLPDALCADDGACRCMCPDGTDPDCGVGQCTCVADDVCNCDCGAEVDPDCAPDECPAPVLDPLDLRSQPISEADLCPDTLDPVVLYMSNDDSNSQASPVLARRYVEEGRVMPAQRVRIHEFLNYYDLGSEHPTDAAAKVGIQMRRTVPDGSEFTLVLSASSREMTHEDRPPLNLVFSLDTSGSMQGEPMALLKEAMVATAGQLRAGDVISVVTWSTSQDLPLEGYVVSGPDDPELLAVIAGLQAGGGTDLHAGLQFGYQLANTYHIDDGINRVMLVSDGGANAGVTDIDLIASEAQDNDGEGTYLIGIGVGTSAGYNDHLMDQVTDAGKGAYVFVDRPQEAHRMLGEHFLSNVAVVARNVQMKLTLPWYFGIKSFHGEEYSPDPTEVEPQHLGPNDTMTFHQIIAACDPTAITDCDSVQARVDYVDPITGEAGFDQVTVPIEDVVVDDAQMLYKADVIVGYAKALIVIAQLVDNGEQEQAHQVAASMASWAQLAADTLDDDEVAEIASIMTAYAQVLE